MRLFLMFLLALNSCSADPLLAFPENIRHGYQSCSACHISPTGGGVLSAYGRAQSASFMSTWAYKGEEQPDYGAFLTELPSWIAVGGDARQINVSVKTPQYKATQKFVMQEDLELAISPIPGITIDASGGLYGPQRDKEYRRNYIKAQVTDGLSLRAGHFIPAYGIQFADHTIATRQGLGLGQGDETFNGEASYSSEYGEAFLTYIAGTDPSLGVGAQKEYKLRSDMVGFSSKVSANIGERVVIGASVLRVDSQENYRHAIGGFVMAGFSDTLYAMAEYDQKDEGGSRTALGAWRLGWELLRGFHTLIIGDLNDKNLTQGLSIQWLPTPHWEIVGEIHKSKSPAGPADSTVLMLHYYL